MKKDPQTLMLLSVTKNLRLLGYSIKVKCSGTSLYILIFWLFAAYAIIAICTSLAQKQVCISSFLLIENLKEVFNSTRHIVLYYEDLVKNRTILKDVQKFLRVPLMELTSRQVKIHKGPLRDHVGTGKMSTRR